MALPKCATIFVTGATLVASLTACGPLVWSAKPSSAVKPAARHVDQPRPTSSPTTTPTTAPTTTPTTTSSTTTPGPASVTDAYETRILVLVNDARAQQGLSPLVASTCADTFAERWAPVLQQNGALSHQSLGPILTSCHASTAGENVAYGNVTADEMMTMWMNSSGHRANILNPSFTAIGVAAVTDSSGRWYGVQDFIG
jgi:uncharacterized protein YkwD